MPEEIEYSFAREVWKRYRSSFSAMFGLTVIILLCLIAVAAPLLANHLPLLVRMNGAFFSRVTVPPPDPISSAYER